MACVQRVTETLKPLPGVAKINVDFPKRLAHCRVDSGEFDVDSALEQLASAGYESTVVTN